MAFARTRVAVKHQGTGAMVYSNSIENHFDFDRLLMNRVNIEQLSLAAPAKSSQA